MTQTMIVYSLIKKSNPEEPHTVTVQEFPSPKVPKKWPKNPKKTQRPKKPIPGKPVSTLSLQTPFFNSLPETPQSLIIALDLEWFEQTHGEHVQEIGLAIEPRGYPSCTLHLHYIIQEHYKYTNRRCPTSKLGFIFGESLQGTIPEITSHLQFWLSGAGHDCPVELVVHNGDGDARALGLLGIDIVALTSHIHDTGKLARKPKEPRISLINLCLELEIQHDPKAFHNAGNDAAYTLLAFRSLGRGENKL